MEEEIYAVIDLKSFYASCECAARGLNIFKTPLVVADASRSLNSIVMSATPYLKEHYNVPNVCRINDLPKVKGLIYAKPRMAYYVEISAKIVSLFLDFVAEEDLHVYSIDESFLRLTPYLKLNDCDADTLVSRIQKRIKDEFGLIATAGMGPNMFLAKTCLDNEGKKTYPYRAYWGMKDVPTKLWRIAPITKVWGIAGGISRRLSNMGIRSMEALAKASPKALQHEFGIMGLQLHDLANGIDHADITQKYVPKEVSFSQGQVLMKDYTVDEARLVIKEIVDELCVRLRANDARSKLVSLFIGYSMTSGGGGLHHQCALDVATDDNEKIFSAASSIYAKHVENRYIRNIVVCLGKLSSYSGLHQQSLLDNEEEEMKNRRLRLAIDTLSNLYGKNTVLRASSLLSASTIRHRHTLIGGHNA